MDSSVSQKDEIWFLRVCHHISDAVWSTILQIIAAQHTTVANCTNKQYRFFKLSLLILIPDHGYLQSWECGDVAPFGCDSQLLACSALKCEKLCSVVCRVDVCLCMGKIGIILSLILKASIFSPVSVWTRSCSH